MGWLAGLLFLAGAFGVGKAGYIHAKAWLAQQLIASAWASTLAEPGQPHRPWSWADTWPVARLALPGQPALYVLNGGQGNALAFGPGLVEGSAQPGDGFAAIGGHRDTHFSTLQQLEPGSRLWLQTRSGDQIGYAVLQVQVVNIHEQPLYQGAADELVLVTCYPFDAVQADPALRYTVTARKIRL